MPTRRSTLALDRPALGVDVVLDGEPLALRQAELLGGELASRGTSAACAYQARISASLCRRLTRTWPARVAAGALAAPPPRSSACTWRRVTGSIASALRSTTPNGAAANLAIGGASPVATLSGKLAALASGRPALSFSSRGRSTLYAAFSAQRLRETRSRSPRSALSSLSNTGASGVAARRRAAAPAPPARAAPAPRSAALIGRIGRHGAFALLALAAELGREGGAHARSESAARSSSPPAGWRRRRCPCPRPAAAPRRSAAAARSARSAVRSAAAPVDAARLQQLRAQLAADDARAAAARRCLRPRTRRWPARSPRPPAPFRRSRKCWSSSISAPSPGCIETIAGPPVEKPNSLGAGERRRRGRAARRDARLPVGAKLRACSACRAAAARESRRARRGRSPSGRLPAGTAPWQLTANGSARRGSPNGDHRFRELDRDLAHLGDLALRADGDDGGRGVRADRAGDAAQRPRRTASQSAACATPSTFGKSMSGRAGPGQRPDRSAPAACGRARSAGAAPRCRAAASRSPRRR